MINEYGVIYDAIVDPEVIFFSFLLTLKFFLSFFFCAV